MLGVAFRSCRLGQRLNRSAIDGGAAAPAKRRAVHGDCLAVELYGALDRRGGERDGAELISGPDAENICPDRLAEQRCRYPRRIDEVCVLASGIRDNGALEPLAGQREVGIAGEFAWQKLVGIDDHLRGAVLYRRQHFARTGHNDVAAEHEIGAAGGHANGMDVLWPLGKANMAEDRATLLREARHVEDTYSPALEMGCHTEYAANGYDASAADAGDDDIIGLLDPGELRLRQLGKAEIGDHAPSLFQLGAVDGDERGAESFYAGEILVTARLIDGALAPPFGFQRLHRDAI